MAESWKVMPGLGAAGGGGPVAGTATNFRILKPDGSQKSATFLGLGGTLGGPASLTWSDKATPGYAGEMYWCYGSPQDERLLKNPNAGLLLSLGTAPRHFLTYFGFPVDPEAVSGFYVMIVVFGVTSPPAVSGVGLIQDSVTAASVLADIKFETKGKLLAGARAYAAVASAAKGVDVGGATFLTGQWMFH